MQKSLLVTGYVLSQCVPPQNAFTWCPGDGPIHRREGETMSKAWPNPKGVMRHPSTLFPLRAWNSLVGLRQPGIRSSVSSGRSNQATVPARAVPELRGWRRRLSAPDFTGQQSLMRFACNSAAHRIIACKPARPRPTDGGDPGNVASWHEADVGRASALDSDTS
jgi:hypothetical protein